MSARSSAVPPLIALQCHHHSYLCAHSDAIKFDPGSGRKTFVIPHEEKLTFKQLLSLLHVDKLLDTPDTAPATIVQSLNLLHLNSVEMMSKFLVY